jgi:hypothetical protein
VRLDKLALIRSSGRNQRWFIISAAIHVVAIVGLILLFTPIKQTRTVSYIDLGSPEQQPMPAYRGPGGTTRDNRPVAPNARPSAPAPPLPAPVMGPPPSRLPAPSEAVTPSNGDNDSLPVDTHRPLGPDYGDGRLWVRAGDAVEGRLPARAAVDSMPVHVARVDSALAAKIRTYLDTVPPDSFATRPAPKWTTEIAGKTWGIDGKWIYLGGIKIPTAILALIPIPVSGNYDGQNREAKIEANRRDIMESGERAANAVEFNKYVKEVRARKEMEHRAHETPPPPPPPTPVASDTTRKQQPLVP